MTILMATFMASGTAVGEQKYLGLVTGDLKGTAHQIGMDLKALFKRNNIHLAVFNSSGSVENIFAVYQRPGNHLGLVQADVLSFVGKVDTDHRLRLIADKVKWVFPLYDQEIHVLANATIVGFDGLHGKRVAIGQPESGTFLTSQLLFEISGIMPAQVLAIDHVEALDQLRSGAIDAMIIVDGAPIEQLALDISAADNLHLLPVTHDGIRSFYPASQIPAGTYPWQAIAVDTVSVKIVLVAYDFRNHHCRTIGTAARLMIEDMEWLRSNGHPKWQRVDLKASVKGWERYKCADLAFSAETDEDSQPSRARKPNPVADAIEAMFRR
jgi:TRAP transporter TAXI family solute receptor